MPQFNIEELKSIKAHAGIKMYISESLDYLGGGGTRAAYNLGDRVLKVAHYDDFNEINRREVKLWETVKGTEEATVLAPIHTYDKRGYYWVIMSRMRPLPYDDFREKYFEPEVNGKLTNLRKAYGLDDIQHFNCGLNHENQFKVIDYAANGF